MSSKRVAVLGAGPVGLIASKCLLEEELSPVVFERTGFLGGLWRYHDEDDDRSASVMRSTIINSSKELTSLSDFPVPEHFPNYMHHRQVHEFFSAFAKTFGLEQYIRYHKDVIKVDFANDYDETGRLSVTVRDTLSQETSTEVFDGVLVCVGHHVYPNVPHFPGIESFKGKCVHTHSLKKVDSFEDLNVVVVGVGNSGVDAAAEISIVSKQVYLSTRTGSWVLPRVGPWGLPLDVLLTRRWLNFIFQNSPYSLNCWFSQMVLNHYHFDHEVYNLKPKHLIWSQQPTTSDHLAVRLLSGRVAVRKNINRFVENGVVFEGDTDVTPCDSVVFGTGYKIIFPFLDDKLTTIKENETHLYKYVFPPHLKHPTLAILGLFQSLGAGTPIAEAQSRWVTKLLKGQLSLPPRSVMEADVHRRRVLNWKRYAKSQRHTIQVDYIPYIDEISSLFGAKPNLFKFLFTDYELFLKLLFGPSLPYQYRLQGPHPWKGAREAIMGWEKRVKLPTNKGFKTRAKTIPLTQVLKFVLPIMVLIWMYKICYIC